MPSKYKKKIAVNVIWMIGVIILFVVISFTYILSAQTFLTEGIERQSMEIVNQGEQQIGKTIDINFNTLHMLSREAAAVDALNINLSQLLIDSQNSDYIRIGYIDKRGVARGSDGTTFSAADRKYFQQSIQGLDSVSEVIDERVGHKRGEPIIVMSVPVIRNANIDGVLFATMRQDSFAKVVNINFYDGLGHTLVTDNSGKIIFNSGNMAMQGNLYDYINPKDLPRFRESINQNGRGIVKLLLNNRESYICYKNISKLNNWNFVTIMSDDAALGKMKQVEYSTIGLFVILMISFFCITLYLIYYQHKQDKLLNQYAYIDSVTGIGNRHAFINQAVKIMHDIRSTADNNNYIVLSLDIDNFKLVNNIVGFSVGNVVLKILGQSLQSYWGNKNLYARLSDDNFVCLLKGYTANDHLTDKLLRFQEAFLSNLAAADIKVKISLAYGIYCLVPNDHDVNEILDKAAVACSEAKLRNKNKIALYDDSLWQRFEAEYTLEKNITIALEQHQFVVYLQPKFSFKTKQIVGAEALIRWQHPVDGFILPTSFIPVAEKTGLIVAIDRYVLREVCGFLRQSLDNNLPVYPIAINCSMIEFYQTDFVEYIEQTVAAYNVPYNLIEIEITETTIISELPVAQHIIKQLKSLGMKITMDDFGTGYSSLSYLQKIAFDCMKLDKSFLNEFENDLHGRNIIKSIIDLAKNLQLTVVAEGIETFRQAEFLHSLNCDYAQGYYFARPMPMEMYKDLLFNAHKTADHDVL